MNMSFQVVISGVGGRGVLMLSRILAELCKSRGVPVMGSDELGMSQRGGSVSSFIKMGNFSSPLVGTGCADCLISMELDEGLRNLPFLRCGGYLFLNIRDDLELPGEIRGFFRELSLSVYSVDCDAVSREVGNPRVSNMAMLGLVWKVGLFPFGRGELMEVVRSLVPERFFGLNIKAFEMGMERGHPLE